MDRRMYRNATFAFKIVLGVLVASCRGADQPELTQLYCKEPPFNLQSVKISLEDNLKKLDRTTWVVVLEGDHLLSDPSHLIGIYFSGRLEIMISLGGLGDREMMVTYLSDRAIQKKSIIEKSLIISNTDFVFRESTKSSAPQNFCSL